MDQAAKMNALVGTVIDGRYEVQAPIGSGAMGQVYRARQIALDRDVALKVLNERHAQDAELVGRFKREARAASAIGHPGIVQVFDFGTLADGRAYLVMELVDGRSLASLLSERRALEPARAVDIVIRVCHVLTAAHERGIVHRDLKPDNLLVLDGDRVKLIDFGIAKLLDVSLVLTKTNTMVGTPLYMAPEQWQGDEVDGRTDLYALGGVLFEMIAGRPPFETDHLHAIITKHLTETPPALKSLVPSVPSGVSDLVARCLAKAREDRPVSAQALADALAAAMSETVAYAPTQETPEVREVLPVAATAVTPATSSHSQAYGGHVPPPGPLSRTEPYHGRRVAPIPRRGSFLPALLILGGLATLLISGGLVYAGLRLFAGEGGGASPERVPPAAPIAPTVHRVSDESAPEPEPAPEAASEPEPAPEAASEPAPARRPETASRASTVVLRSEPPGAVVIEDAVRIGRTPLRLEVEEERELLVTADGYEPKVIRLRSGPGPRVVRLERRAAPASTMRAPPPASGTGHSSRTRGWDD